MKRTELERRQRMLKRVEKKTAAVERAIETREPSSVATYIENLHSLLYYNDKEVMNIVDNIDILELFEQLKDDHPEKQWAAVVKKAVRKTGVAKKSQAISQLTTLLEY